MKNKLAKFKTIFIYFNAVLLLLIMGAVAYYTVSLYSKAQACFTVEQVQQSSKCLYVYKTSVYEKGTRAQPHHGNPCGSDVTTLIPNSHILDKVGHLDPNYQGEICANNPLPSPTQQPSPTTAPTNTPAPTTQQAPTATPVIQAVNTIPTATQAPSQSQSQSVSPTATPKQLISSSVSIPASPALSSTIRQVTTSDSDISGVLTPTPTTLTTLPVTGRLEWVAAGLIPVSLVILGIIF